VFKKWTYFGSCSSFVLFFYILPHHQGHNAQRKTVVWIIVNSELVSWFLARLILLPWRWRRYVPPKRRLTFNGLHCVISQKIALFITTTVRTSNPTSTCHLLSRLYLARLILRPWRWKRYVPPKRRLNFQRTTQYYIPDDRTLQVVRCLENSQWKKTQKKVDSWSSGWDLNGEPPKYKSGGALSRQKLYMLTLQEIPKTVSYLVSKRPVGGRERGLQPVRRWRDQRIVLVIRALRAFTVSRNCV
jgi:hypothetical protein